MTNGYMRGSCFCFCFVFFKKPLSHLHFSNKEMKSFPLYGVQTVFHRAEGKKKNEAFKGVFSVSFFSGSSICAAFGKISGHRCFVQGQTPDCCALPGVSIFRITPPPPTVLSSIQAVTSPANCNLPNAFNKKVGRSVASGPLSS